MTNKKAIEWLKLELEKGVPEHRQTAFSEWSLM